MRQVSVSVFISAPRERIYDFVVDLAARPAFTDHYLGDLRPGPGQLVRQGRRGPLRAQPAASSERGELAIVEADRPRRIVEEGRLGRLGRSRFVAVYEFTPEAGGTRVELTTLSDPVGFDRVRQAGVHRWMRRKTMTSLKRLRAIFEDPPKGELARVTVAGYDAYKSPRFGSPAGSDPSRAG